MKKLEQTTVVGDNICENVVSSTTSATPTSSRGRKKVIRSRSAQYRENQSLRNTVNSYRTTINRYRKRLQRLCSTPKNVDSPQKITAAMIRTQNKKAICKTLKFHNVLLKQIKDKYRDTKTDTDRRALLSTIAGNIIHKYRMMNVLRKEVGFGQKYVTNLAHKTHARSYSSDDSKKVKIFYERDDVSRVCPGLKQTITRQGVKKQLATSN